MMKRIWFLIIIIGFANKGDGIFRLYLTTLRGVLYSKIRSFSDKEMYWISNNNMAAKNIVEIKSLITL